MSRVEDVYKKLQKDFPGRPVIDFVDTGSLVLNDCMGGGYPRGRIIEMYGQTGTGKSTILLHGCQAACDKGMRGVYIDTEWSVNQTLLDGIGITKHMGDKFLLHKARTFAEIDTLMETYLDTENPPEIIVIDSAQAMLPSKRVTGGVEDVEPGLQARMMSAFLQKYKAWLGHANTALAIINQVRMKFEQRGRSWNVKEGSAGGNALGFYSDVRLELRPGPAILEDPADYKTAIGNEVRVEAKKNKVCPMRNCIIPIIYGKGISNVRSMLLYLEAAGAVTQAGPWYKIDLGDGAEHKAKGKNGFADWVRDHFTEIKDFLKKQGYLP